MKKKHFTIVFLALTLGAFAAIGTHFVIGAQADAIMAVAEETQTSAEAEPTDEEKSRLQEIIDELTAKYNQIKDIQVAGTTIGAIAGALVGAIVSAIPALLNRQNIKKAIENVGVCQENVSKVGEVLTVVQEKFDVTNENYVKAVEAVNALSKELKDIKASLEVAEENYAALKQDNDQLREIVVLMVNHTKEYVANGTAEYVNSKFKE